MILRELINLIGFDIDQAAWNRTNRAFDQMARRARDIGAKMTIALTAPFGFLAKSIIETIGTFEQLEGAFGVMLGSAEKAAVVIADLTDLAATTPFEIKDIFKSAKRLLAVGIEADNLRGSLVALGNLASGIGVPLSQLIKAFGDVKAKTKLTGEEMRQFTGAGVPLLEKLAEQMGKTKAEVLKLQSQGKIGFKEVEKAIKSFSEKGGQFFNLMLVQSKTLFGLWSNFRDLIQISFRQLEGLWLPVLKDIVKLAIDIVAFISTNLNPNMVRFITILGLVATAMGPILLAIGFLTLPMIKLVAILTLVSSTIALIIDDFIVFSNGGKSFMGRFLPPWEELKPKITAALMGAWNIIKKIMGQIKLLIQGVVGFVNAFINEDIDGMGNAIMKIVGVFWKGIKLFLFKIAPFMLRWFVKFQAKFMAAIAAFVLKIKRIIEGVLAKFNVVQNITDKFKSSTDFLAGKLGLNTIFGTETAKAKAKGGDIHINANINTTVPEGTPEEQKTGILDTAKQVYGDLLKQMATDISAEFAEVE